MEEIKRVVTEEEIKKLDSVVKEIYSIDYDNNHSTAYKLGFDTVANLNGGGYINLVRIVDNLNDDDKEEEFARYLLEKVFDEKKLERLKKELKENRNRYITLLYL